MGIGEANAVGRGCGEEMGAGFVKHACWAILARGDFREVVPEMVYLSGGL